MSLTSVKMSEEVWLTCLTHALSTETEEIMGLLLGDIEVSKNGSATALIWGASPQTRSDRRKDRVETNPEQLAAASAQAERMTLSTGRRTRVIGWYHSHPHITVLPSHVDVRTQRMFQLLDSGFIGLIFSCFNEDANKVGRIQIIAFQSSDGKQNHDVRPISLSSTGRSSVMDVGSSSSVGQVPGDEISSDFGSYFAYTDANYPGKERSSGSLNNAFVDEVDPMDISDGMQEAMHRSTLDVSNSEFIRKEIPLLVLPTSSLLKLESPLRSFMDLQRVLYEEERAAYNQAIVQNTRNGKVHPLTFIHHTSTYQASVCKLMEYCLTPAISALEDRLRENEIRLEMLRNEAKVLETKVKEGNLNSGSPRQKLRISGASPHSRSSGSVHGDPHNSTEPIINVRGVVSPGSRSERGPL